MKNIYAAKILGIIGILGLLLANNFWSVPVKADDNYLTDIRPGTSVVEKSNISLKSSTVLVGKIAFISSRDKTGYTDIYEMYPDGSDQIRITDTPINKSSAVFSPDGKKIAYVTQDSNRKTDIYVINSDGSNNICLTEDTTSDYHPVWSPDSSRIAYLSAVDGSYQICVMDADGSNRIQLTNESYNYSRDPCWSPDGEKIAFSSNRVGVIAHQIYMIDSDGLNLTRITEYTTNIHGAEQPSWSPDGSRIVFRGYYRDSNDTAFYAEILVMNTDGTNIIPLSDRHNFINEHPVWSPDSSQIAFVSYNNSSRDIIVTKSDGSGDVFTIDQSDEPVWSPDGAYIAYNSVGNIYIMTSDGRNPSKLTDYSRDNSISWAINSAKIATKNATHIDTNSARLNGILLDKGTATSVKVSFEYWTDNPESKTIIAGNPSSIHSIPQGGALFTANLTGLTPGQTYHFKAKAEGKNGQVLTGMDRLFFTLPIPLEGRIAYVSSAKSNMDIYVFNADGSDSIRLTNNQYGDDHPSFSPDGKKIAYAAQIVRSDIEIFAMNADGTNKTNLTNNPAEDVYPAWSPDGTKIAFASNRDNESALSIYVMNIDGSQVTRLTMESTWNDSPAWSPDGSKIVFVSDRDIGPVDPFGNINPYEIYVMNADGYDVERLTDNTYYDSHPAWSPDGSKIAFYSGRDNDSIGGIYIMDINGSNQIKIHDGVEPCWSPDGTEIAFTDNENIYISKADGSKTVKITGLSETHFYEPSWACSAILDLALVTTSLPNGYSGIEYSQLLTATGGLTPYTWSIKSGALPAGLTLDKSSGLISGKPSKAKTYNFTVKVTDSATPKATATQPLSITINPALKISTAALPTGYTDTYYSQNMAAAGGTGNYTWSLKSGTLPEGFDLDSNGELCGTTEATGAFPFYVQVDDGLSSVINSQPLILNIYDPLVITATSLPDGDVKAAYSGTLTAIGGVSPYKWSKSGNWPKGLTLSSKGVIRGKLSAPGTYDFTLKVTDKAKNTTSVPFSIKVNSAVTLTSNSLMTAEVNIPYSWIPAASGGDGQYTWSYKGSLPAEFSFDNSTGVISGVPTAETNNVSLTIKVTDDIGGSATKSLRLKIYEAVTITTDALKEGKVGAAYNVMIRAKDGGGKYTWSLAEGSNSLPEWASLNPKNGAITTNSGKKATTGTWEFTIKVTDTLGATDTKSFTITIK